MIEIAEKSLKNESVVFSKPRFGIIRVENYENRRYFTF